MATPKTYPSDITREQFEHIKPILESARKRTHPRTYDLYDVWNGLNYVLKTGCQWRALPHEYPKWRTVHEYFSIWKQEDQETKQRHIAVDTNGFPHAVAVTTANVTDRQGALSIAQEVLRLITATTDVVKRNELHTFTVLPKRWVVERSFGWLEKCRRLWKNCERFLESSRAMMQLAFISLLLRRC